jgi:hypothetical protein
MLDPSNKNQRPPTRILTSWTNYLATISPLQHAIYEGIPQMYSDYQPYLQGDPRSTRLARINLPVQPSRSSPTPEPRHSHTSSGGYITTQLHTRLAKRQRDQHHPTYPQPPRRTLQLGEVVTSHLKTPRNNTPISPPCYHPHPPPHLPTKLQQTLPSKTPVQESINDKVT